MPRYRLTSAAQQDIVSILSWSQDTFGDDARERYEALITTAIRDAASNNLAALEQTREEFGAGVFFWHLAQSRAHSSRESVDRPRHFLVCRRDHDVLIIGRVLHDAMDPQRHVDFGRDPD